MPSEIHLLYTSRSVSSFTESELEELAIRSAERNEKLGITGVLLYGGGRFLQLLEGASEAVNPLYDEKIAHDSRHTDCRVLVREACETRLLPSWAMGRIYLQEADGSAQEAWDTLCMAIGEQNPAAIFARAPVVNCMNRFIEHIDDHADLASGGWANKSRRALKWILPAPE